MIYEKFEDPKNPYHRLAILPSSTDTKQDRDYPQLQAGIMNARIKSVARPASEDVLYFTTDNN